MNQHVRIERSVYDDGRDTGIHDVTRFQWVCIYAAGIALWVGLGYLAVKLIG